jgi:hypothetical protein
MIFTVLLCNSCRYINSIACNSQDKDRAKADGDCRRYEETVVPPVSVAGDA